MPQHSLECIHQNVLLPISCSLVPSYWKRGLSVIMPMWYDLHVSSDSKSSESKRSICMEFLHAYIPIDMVRMSQYFSKTSESKDPSNMELSSCVLYQYDSSASATSMWYYLISFGMNMCITTIEIQQTIHFKCKNIEGIIQINRVTIILLKWITVLR